MRSEIHNSLMNRRGFARTASGVLLATGAAPLFAAPPSSSGVRKELIVYGATPHNAEPARQHLVKSWITPLKHFYVRSHAPVPKIDADQFVLSVEGLVRKPLQITLGELKEKFAKRTIVATMTCAGNRRSEHSLVEEVSGVQWSDGAIGNARWGGVVLAELLKKAGVKENAKHVWFEGLDQVKRKGNIIPFGASIPMDKALANSAAMPGTLLAHEMNGQPLLPDHGFPL
ncbi:MAG: molybdopterin-dependent oxidoreductase, partial [Planctomycetales bacterium]